MGSPTIFSGRRTKLLTADGLLTSTGAVMDNDGVKNYIKNGHAEVDTTGWATYADAAGTSPVDGTGGSPTVTWTRSTSSPLAGQGSFLLTKDAANRQGEGVYYDFTIDSIHQAKVLSVRFDYLVSSGTFVAGSSSADSDVTVWLYDVTNSTLIQPSSIKLFSSSTTLTDQYRVEFQTAPNSTSYRLILHCGSTSASAYVLKIDNISVTPSQYVYGTPITDWQDWTPTVTGLGTVTVNRAKWRRVGDSHEYDVRVTAGTVDAASVTFTTPNSAALDYASSQLLGYGHSTNTTNSTFGVIWDSSGATNLLSVVSSQTGASGFAVLTGNTNFANSNVLTFQARAKIVGLSSSVQMSDSADTRVVAFRATASGSTTIAASSTPTKLAYNTVITDSHGAFDTTNNRFTAPVAGWYRFSASMRYDSLAWTQASRLDMRLYKNGSNLSYLDSYLISYTGTYYPGAITGSTQIYLNAGDYVEVFLINPEAGTRATLTDSSINWFTGERISGPSAIAATETIAAYYTGTPTGTLAGGAYNTTTFPTKGTDTHSAYSGGTYTIPATGTYSISAGFSISGATVTSGNYVGIMIAKNGSGIASQLLRAVETSASGTQTSTVSVTGYKFNAGDLVTIKGTSNYTTPAYAAALLDASENFFSIVRTGL